MSRQVRILYAEFWAGLSVCGLEESAPAALPRGDERKALIALAVKRETTVPLDWLVQRLQMGARGTVSRETAVVTQRLRTVRDLATRYQQILSSAAATNEIFAI